MPAKKRWTEEAIARLTQVYQSTEDWAEILAALPGFTKSAIQGRASILGLPKLVRVPSNVPTYDEGLFDQWNERSAYLLGYLEADGCFIRQRQGQPSETMTVRFATSVKDAAFAHQLQSLVGRSGLVATGTCTLPTGLSHQYTTFQITSRPWMRALSGCVRVGHVPECITQELLHHYVRGYFDGDGSVFWNRQVKHFRSNLVFGDLGLAESMAAHLRPILCSKLTVYGKVNSQRCWYLNLGNEATARLARFIYRDATIYLTRKYERLRGLLLEGKES